MRTVALRPTESGPLSALALAALACASLATASCVNARSLLREGRLYDACNRVPGGSPDDEAAVFAELRRRAPAHLLLHVATGGADASGAALPATRAGYLATQTVTLAATPEGSPRIALMVDTPNLAPADGGALADWRFNDQMDERLAYSMLTGRDPGPANASLAGLMVDGTALLLSGGVVDPRLRGEWSASLRAPASQRAPVAELLARFTRPGNPQWNCELEAGRQCTKLLALTPAEGPGAATHFTVGFYWQIFSGTDACLMRRDVDVPLGPGPDVAARVNAVFANGPVDAFDLPARRQ